MDSDLSGIIRQNTHFFKVRVFYEDTDFTGIVYHANYLKFAERGRTNFLRLLDINHSELIDSEDPKFFVVYKMKSKLSGLEPFDTNHLIAIFLSLCIILFPMLILSIISLGSVRIFVTFNILLLLSNNSQV